MKLKARTSILFSLLGVALVILFFVDLMVGSVSLPLKDVWGALTGGDVPESTSMIVVNIRLVKAVVAVMCGAALTVSGLQMQTLFRNPLAGPYVLGVSSGASLGVAIFLLTPLSVAGSWLSSMGVAGAAWIGAAAILVVTAIVGRKVKDIMVILILGMMFSSGVSAVVQILQYLSHEDALKSFVIWTMGSLGEVTTSRLYVLIPAVMAGLVLSVLTIKPLNLLLLGEEYARTMGVSMIRARGLIFLSTTLLAGTVTAFCGPIGFIGLAIPHVTRVMFGNADHRILIPGCVLSGGVVLVACDIVSKVFTLPVNAITALLGIPIVVWIVLRNKTMNV